MTLIPLPPIYLRIRSLELDVPGQTNRSDWGGGRQVIGGPGADTWYAKCAFLPSGREREKRRLWAFLLSMKGEQNWFQLPKAPNQHPGPNPTVAAVLDANTVTLSSAAGLEAGMFATFYYAGRNRLVGLKGDPVGNTISFEPFLRGVPAVGSLVEIRNPFADMSFSNPRNGIDEDEGVATLEFDAEEI